MSYKGFVYDLSNEEYHRQPEVSNTGLSMIAKSPAHFKAGFSGINAKTASQGTAIHSIILEEGRGIVVAPSMGKSSEDDCKKWTAWFMAHGADMEAVRGKSKEWFAEFERQSGTTLVDEIFYNQAMKMVESVHANDEAAELLLPGGVSEASIFGEVCGVKTRVRPDHHRAENHVIVDVKSTKSASNHGFAKSVSDYRYHVQDALYSATYESVTNVHPTFKFIAVEKTKPYPVVVYELSEYTKEIAHGLMERDLEKYKQCLENDEWPGYANNYSLDIPIYDKATLDDLYDAEGL